MEIQLTKGQVALVDEEDFEYLNQFNWCASGAPGRYYALSFMGTGKGQYMHRVILGLKPGEMCDHINGDKLDNRRVNLRLATYAQNNANMVQAVGMTSKGYIGVRQTDQGRYSSCVSVDNKQIYVGTFTTAEEAARARDKVAKALRGEFAVLNFPDEVHDEQT